MQQTATEEKDEHVYHDPYTGEILDKAGYYAAMGVNTAFVISDMDDVAWFLRKQKQLTATVEQTKAMYKRAVKAAEAELNEFNYHFAKDAETIADRESKETGHQTVRTPYGEFKFVNHTKGAWAKNDDVIQVGLRFLPDKVSPEEQEKAVKALGIELPNKQDWGVNVATFTRLLDPIKRFMEFRRQLAEDIRVLQEQNVEVPASLSSKLDILNSLFPLDAMKYTPPGRSCAIAYPKTDDLEEI